MGGYGCVLTRMSARPEEGNGSSRSGVINSCREPLDVGAGRELGSSGNTQMLFPDEPPLLLPSG